jgi:hypothetical protein
MTEPAARPRALRPRSPVDVTKMSQQRPDAHGIAGTMPRGTNGIRGVMRLRAAVAASCVGSVALGYACGGTTGHEGLSTPGQDASVTDDSTVDLDSGAFDVAILYADRVLPDVAAPPPAPDAAVAVEAGFPWPNCPPFIAVDSNGNPIDPSEAFNQIPAAYDDAGLAVPAPEGSPCAEYPWLGSTTIDSCVTQSSAGTTPPPIFFPPCNWCVDAGLASAGSGKGQPRFDLCIALYACVANSGCAAQGQGGKTCLCGSDIPNCSMDASGPCVGQELAALEYPAMSPDVLKNFTNSAPNAAGFPGFCAGNFNAVLQAAASNGCFEAGAP